MILQLHSPGKPRYSSLLHCCRSRRKHIVLSLAFSVERNSSGRMQQNVYYLCTSVAIQACVQITEFRQSCSSDGCNHGSSVTQLQKHHAVLLFPCFGEFRVQHMLWAALDDGWRGLRIQKGDWQGFLMCSHPKGLGRRSCV